MTQDLSTDARRGDAPLTPRDLRVRIAETRVRQKRVARRLGVSESNLSNTLAGRINSDNAELLARIAEAIEAVAAESAA